jgi:hypothetical protein
MISSTSLTVLATFELLRWKNSKSVSQPISICDGVAPAMPPSPCCCSPSVNRSAGKPAWPIAQPRPSGTASEAA